MAKLDKAPKQRDKEGGKWGESCLASPSFFLLLALVASEKDSNANEPYPVKPITFINGLEAGSHGDVLARPIWQKVSTILGKPVVIVNKPGAASSIGIREVHDSKPNGYIVGLASASIVLNKVQEIMPFGDDLVKRFLMSVSTIFVAATFRLR